MLVRPINVVELQHSNKIHTFYPDKWYVARLVRNDRFSVLPNDKFYIETGEKWPYDTIQIYRNAFDTIFVTKEDDRDIKIDDILS